MRVPVYRTLGTVAVKAATGTFTRSPKPPVKGYGRQEDRWHRVPTHRCDCHGYFVELQVSVYVRDPLAPEFR